LFVLLNLQKIINQPDFLKNELEIFDKMVNKGAKGLKVTKILGLEMRDPSGKLVPIDDPRLEPIWNKAGEYKIPVLMHVTDPTPFLLPSIVSMNGLRNLTNFPNGVSMVPSFPKRKR